MWRHFSARSPWLVADASLTARLRWGHRPLSCWASSLWPSPSLFFASSENSSLVCGDLSGCEPVNLIGACGCTHHFLNIFLMPRNKRQRRGFFSSIRLSVAPLYVLAVAMFWMKSSNSTSEVGSYARRGSRMAEYRVRSFLRSSSDTVKSLEVFLWFAAALPTV